MTGRICLDILADKWAAAMDVRGLLLRYVDITPFSPQVIEILANKLFYYRSIFLINPVGFRLIELDKIATNGFFM